MDVASQGRLPGGGGPGAHTVLGGRATEGWGGEGAPSTQASVWAGAGIRLGDEESGEMG